MTNTYPIEFRRPVPFNFVIIEWMLSNVCNFDCSFCSPEIKSGTKRWLDFAVYKNTIEKIINEAAPKTVWFKFTGGEPTLYPDLIKLLQFVRSTNNKSFIMSNGTRTLRWWKELRDANCVDIINLTHHPEQTDDYKKIIDIVEIFRPTPTRVTINVTCIPRLFDKALKEFTILKENCFGNISMMQINDDIGMSKYTEQQKQILLANSFVRMPDPIFPKPLTYHDNKMEMVMSDQSTIVDNVFQFIKREENQFFGWDCDAGKDLLRINHTDVYRATCLIGDKGSIFDDKLLKTSSITCTKNYCTCSLDMVQPKKLAKL